MRLLGERRTAHDDEPHAAAEQGPNLVEYDPDREKCLEVTRYIENTQVLPIYQVAKLSSPVTNRRVPSSLHPVPLVLVAVLEYLLEGRTPLVDLRVVSLPLLMVVHSEVYQCFKRKSFVNPNTIIDHAIFSFLSRRPLFDGLAPP